MSEAKARGVVYERSNWICERCGQRRATEWHHRKNRSQGGKWTPANGMHLCSPCHGVITNTRREFYGAGWCVRRVHDPADQAVMYRGSWVMLDNEGGVTPIDQVDTRRAPEPAEGTAV